MYFIPQTIPDIISRTSFLEIPCPNDTVTSCTQEIDQHACGTKAKGAIESYADKGKSVQDLWDLIKKLERPDITDDQRLINKIGKSARTTLYQLWG